MSVLHLLEDCRRIRMPVNESTTSAELLSGCSCCEPRALWLGSETRVPFDASSGSHLAFPASFQDLKRLKACSGETSAATRASALRPQPRQAVVRSQEMPPPCWGRVCLLPRAGNDWCPHALSAMRLERRTTACPLMAVVLLLLRMRWILGRWALGKVGSRAPLSQRTGTGTWATTAMRCDGCCCRLFTVCLAWCD